MPPQIKTENNKADLIENELGENEEEKNELGENSEQYGKEFLGKITQLKGEIDTLLEQKKEKTKLKETIDQKNVQEIRILEEEINQLEEKIKQKKQELDEIKKDAELSSETIAK